MSRFRTDVFLLVGLVLCMRCGGRVMDEAVVGPPDGGRSSGTGRGSTTGPTPTGPTTGGTTTVGTTTGPIPTTSTASTSTATSSTSTGFDGAGPTTTTVSTTTGFGGAGGGGFGGAGGGFGGAGGAPPVLCTSAPIPGSDQQINCRKPVGQPFWQCACGIKGTWSYCDAKDPFPCGQSNCCGFDTSKSVGCGATPVTLPPLQGCIEPIRGGWLGCAHATQLNSPSPTPFTSCCPPSSPFSCPTGTPGQCFATAEQARANCKEYCVQCVPTMF